jgi:hypothetical protein
MKPQTTYWETKQLSGKNPKKESNYSEKFSSYTCNLLDFSQSIYSINTVSINRTYDP